jgi:hypothetical protein
MESNDTLKRGEIKAPIKTWQTKTRDVKSIEPSSGFENSLKNKSTKIEMNESASSRKSERQRTARVMYEPALTTTDENLNPSITEFDQLMSCLEQDVKAESGKLNNINEDDILKSLQEIGSPDPKSQAAINKMPEHKRKRYCQVYSLPVSYIL